MGHMDNKFYTEILNHLVDKARNNNMLDRAATITSSEVLPQPSSVIIKAGICGDKNCSKVVLKKFSPEPAYDIKNEINKNLELVKKLKDEKNLYVSRILAHDTAKGAILYEYIKGPSFYNYLVNMTIPPMGAFKKKSTHIWC